jgi:hypothetical protein
VTRASTGCDACGGATLSAWADLGTVPVHCGMHFAAETDARASPWGQVTLGCCPECGYVRNLAFDEQLIRYDTSMDMDLHHSPAFRRLTTELVERLAGRFPLAGAQVADIGCAQGDLLRELCRRTGCTGTGWDPAYTGPAGADGSGAAFHAGFAPRGADLPPFDVVICRHWLEHLSDPYEFLLDLRVRLGDRPGRGYLEVPDAGYDLTTAGWQVIYPHVSYFDAYALCRIAARAGWRVDATGSMFSGMLRWIEISANVAAGPADAALLLPGTADRDRHLAAIAGLSTRYTAERDRWRGHISRLADEDARPVLWGAGSRSVQFLAAADPDRRLSAVVDLNPRKWGRYLPGRAHQVEPPASLASLQPRVVILTNPAYRDEIAKHLAGLGVAADLLLA